MRVGDRDAPHTFFWFNECLRVEGGGVRPYCIEGIITFDDVTILRADGSERPLGGFVDDGVRWWQAFPDSDERVSVEAQAAWNAARLTWREWPGVPKEISGR